VFSINGDSPATGPGMKATQAGAAAIVPNAANSNH
jgi:hypothetical protein